MLRKRVPHSGLLIARVAGSYGFARMAGSYVRRDVFSLADLPRLVGIALNRRPAAP